MEQQRRIARTWDDVPATVRADVRAEVGDDLGRVELIDRPGGYSVVVHPESDDLDGQVTAAALGDDPAMQEVLARTRPQKLHRRQ